MKSPVLPVACASVAGQEQVLCDDRFIGAPARGINWRPWFALLASLAGCGRFEHIAYTPPTTPEQWCALRPCVRVGGTVFTEPLGTGLVFALAALWIAAGVHAWRTRDGQRSRAWLAVALFLGGAGAACAGVSYQALSYELKCAGRELCVWTNAFEVTYLIAQTASAGAMLAAVAHARVRLLWRAHLLAYAAANTLAYAMVAATGMLLAERTLLSFELMLAFAAPGLLAVLGIGGRGYRADRDPLCGRLVAAVLGLLAVQVAYFAYGVAGMTQRLWNGGTGFYFSDNDVLHVGMILWIARFARPLTAQMRDRLE